MRFGRLEASVVLNEEFSTAGPVSEEDRALRHNGFFHRIENLAPGEGRVYRVMPVGA